MSLEHRTRSEEIIERDQPGDWFDLAACKGRRTEIFYPNRGEPGVYDAAIAICQGCPIRWRCLNLALDNREMYGVWGGRSPRSRHSIRKGSAERTQIRNNAYLEGVGLAVS